MSVGVTCLKISSWCLVPSFLVDRRTPSLDTVPTDLLSAARGAAGDLLKPAVVGAVRDLRRPRVAAAPSTVPRSMFDPTLPASIADPFADLAKLREHPVWVNEHLGVWMLARHEDVHAATRDNVTFTSRDGVTLRSFETSAVIFADPPDHTRLRHIAAPMFNKREVGNLASGIRELAADGVAELKAGQVVDLVSALTIPMPVTVIAQLLGIPREQWPGFRALSEHFANILGPRTAGEMVGLVGTALPAYVKFRSMIAGELRRRATEPADDLLTMLHNAMRDGDLSEQEAFFYALILLVAGNETTTNLLGILLLKMARDPELFAELKADRSLLPAATEEMARWGSPVQWVTRTITRDHPVGSVVMPRGARVALFYAAANRDPDKFPDPDRFDLHRKPTGHLAFGQGLHFCLGAHLARLEVITAVDQLLDEVDSLELAGPVRWSTTPSLRGPVSLPVRVKRA